ncbi:MAG: TRAP transporter substrate-binding protein, partial [Geminicoccales bacterium]
PPQLYDQARDGVVDIVWTLPGYTPGRFPVSSVFELPFMVDNAEATSQATQEFAEKYLAEEFGDVHLLMLHAHARGTLHLKGKPVTRMEDLVGAKIRAPNKAIADALAALGASPVFMPVTQVAEALSRSVIDGAALPFEITRPLKIHELVDSHTEIPGAHGIYTALFILAMNKASYESLPPDLQKVIDDTTGLAMAKEVGRMWDEAETLGRQAAVDNGNTFNQLTPEEAKRWQRVTQPVVDGWVADMNAQGKDGEKLLAAARGLIAKYSGAN